MRHPPKYPKILLVDFSSFWEIPIFLKKTQFLGSTTGCPLWTRRQQLQRRSTSRSKCPANETSAWCATGSTSSTSSTSILIVGIERIALLSLSLWREQCGDMELLLCMSSGLCKLVPAHHFPLHPKKFHTVVIRFFFKCWERARKPAEQWASPELPCLWGRCQGLQDRDEDMQAAGRFRQKVRVSQLQTQHGDGVRFS